MSKQRPIALQPPFLISLAAVLLFDSGNHALAALLAALCHEAGHLIVMKWCGVTIDRVDIRGFRIEMVSRLHLFCARVQLLVASAGIAANVAAAMLIGVLLCFYCVPFVQTLFYANLVIAAVNLIPIQGLDGGDLYHQMIFLASSGILKKTVAVIRALLLTVSAVLALFLLWRHRNPILCLFLFFVIFSNRKGKKPL